MKKLPEIGINAPHPEGVNVMRTDYVTDKRVILATARAKRPEQFTVPKEKKTLKKDCPFCPQNQDKIIIADEVKTKTGWKFRSVVNLFGIMKPEGDIPTHFERTSTLNETNAYGHAEVIIETPEHDQQLEDLPRGRIAEWLEFIGKRATELYKKPGVRYVSIFKNRGRIAGASISHSHTQLITTPHVPKLVQEIRHGNTKHLLKHTKNIFKEIIEEERGGPRFIMENDHVACFAPYASEAPMEAWIVPKRHISSVTLLNQEERKAIENVLRKLLKRLNTLGTPPYNLLFISDNEYAQSQLHLRLYPRINTPQAGFELTTGLSVNPTLPEDAATFYRGK